MNSFMTRLLVCLRSVAIAMILLSVVFGVNYFVVTRTCPDGKRYELPSFASKKKVHCRKEIKIQDYSATFSISPNDLDVLKKWNPFDPNVAWNQAEWRRSTVHSETEAQKTNLEKKAEDLSSFWYKAYHPGDQSFEILIDTTDSSEYVGYIDATFIEW
ncbi:MAG: hypothetical protein AAFP20_17655 [Cyanobacteria bacterium J06614_10]